MKRLSTILLALTIAAMSTNLVLAKEGDKGGDKGGDKKKQEDKAPAVRGALSKVSDTEIVIKTKKDGDVTVKVDAKTAVKIDGKDAKLADLKPGMLVTVPANESPATKISAHDHKEGDGHDHGKEGKEKGKEKPKA